MLCRLSDEPCSTDASDVISERFCPLHPRPSSTCVLHNLERIAHQCPADAESQALRDPSPSPQTMQSQTKPVAVHIEGRQTKSFITSPQETWYVLTYAVLVVSGMHECEAVTSELQGRSIHPDATTCDQAFKMQSPITTITKNPKYRG